MKQAIFILLGLTVLWGCKEDTKQVTKQTTEHLTLKKDSVPKSPIRVFSIVHDSTYVNDHERLTELNVSLNKSYKEDKHVQDGEYLTETLESYKQKRFAKHLAKEFENDNFTGATQTNVTFLAHEGGERTGNIRVAEWYFKEEATAQSCFENLPSHLEKSIRYKFISWIWVQQKNRLFLISTMNYNVETEPMQTVKQHLIDVLKKYGDYKLFEMR